MSVKQKKSQVTIFLTLGIVIVIMIVVLIAISRYSIKKTSEQELLSAKEIVFDTQPIKNFVSGCLFIVSKEGLKQSFEEEPIQAQLEIFVKNNIDNCLDFSAFQEQGFGISKKEATIEVSINENNIVFKMEYPIIINNLVSGEKTQIKDFIVEHEVIQEGNEI